MRLSEPCIQKSHGRLSSTQENSYYVLVGIGANIQDTGLTYGVWIISSLETSQDACTMYACVCVCECLKIDHGLWQSDAMVRSYIHTYIVGNSRGTAHGV